MANTKQIFIRGEVPFTWLYEGLSDDDARMFVGWFLTPGMGLRLTYHGERYVPNDHGGQTAMYEVWIEGIEAVKIGALERIIEKIREVGTLYEASYQDLDDNNEFYDLTVA